MSNSIVNNGDKRAVPNQIIVKFKSGTEPIEIQSLQEDLGASVIKTTQELGFQLWSLEGLTEEDGINQLLEDPRVEYVEPNYIVSTSAVPNDPGFDELWGINNTGQTGGTPDADIDGLEAYDAASGEGVVVGVIDTGVDYTHSDLNDNMWTNPGETPDNGIDDDGNGYVDDYYGYDFVNGDSDPYDDYGHGTHVAGTIAAEGNNNTGVIGVAPDTQIMALKFLDSGGYGDIFGAIQAIEYSIMMKRDYGVNIELTSNSWRWYDYSQALYDAIAAAGQAGQLFIAAAGNEYNDNDYYPAYPASYNLDNIISVAATDHNDQLTWFSNFGATTVDLGAPGENVYSTVPGNSYEYYDGTSMATPHVSGVASLIWSLDPTLTFQEVKNQILTTVDPISSLEGITVTGGRLNAYNALNTLVSGKIQGRKWNDLNQNGIKDGGEPNLAGWTIYLDSNNNGTLDDDESRTTTNENGEYVFSFLDPGTYQVAEVLQPGWELTYPSGGTHTVEIAEKETVSDINFGNFLANPATISGIKWNDVNKNRIQDPSESVLPGWRIYLDANNNQTLDNGELSALTDAEGAYSFDNLPPGNYTVAETIPIGWKQTYPITTLGRTFLNADFSNGSLDGFTIDNSGGAVNGLWHLSTGRGNQAGHSADDSLYFGTGESANGGGNYDVGFTAGRVTSPVINLTDSPGAQLTFNYFLETEGNTSYDRATVLVARDGGSFELLATNPDLLQDPTTGWTQATFDLTGYAGSKIQLQFDFNTIDRANNNFEGWYIDDVEVTEFRSEAYKLELAPDQNATDTNFGNYEMAKGEIKGTKWNDKNGNGTKDAGETGLAGWTIYLDQNQNGELDNEEVSVVTDENGDYTFTELTPGVNYTVTELPKNTWEVTYPVLPEEYTWSDSDQPGGPVFNWIDISAVGTPLYLGDESYEEVPLSFDFPFYDQEENKVKISSNGFLSFGENAWQGYNEAIPNTNEPNALLAAFWDDLDSSYQGLVYYYNDTEQNRFIVQYQDISHYWYGGSYTFQIILDSDGSILYQYDDLYYVTNEATVGVENYDGTKGLQIAYNEDYLHNDLAVEIKPTTGNVLPYNLTLEEGQVLGDINFGNWQPNTLAGTKWEDLNGNGNKDAGEAGLAGWTIFLDANNNGQLDDLETSTVTDGSGSYSFTVGEGTYTIAEVLKPDWEQTYPAQGKHTVSVEGGVTRDGLDFGNRALPSSISGTKWNDKNANGVKDGGEPGLAGWTIYLDQNQNNQLDNGETSTVTDANGNYSFTNLSYGSYTIAEVLQDGWIQTAGNTTVYLNPNEDITNIDFGNWNPVYISGNKWQDINGDGIKNGADSGLAGWTIFLDANNNGQLDNQETSTVTDADGNYSFTLPEGNYTVAEVLKSGWVQTVPSEGNYSVSLAEGERADNLNFANQPLPGEISGSKWNDKNANGKWDAGELALSDWTIYLDQNKNNQLDQGEISTVTDADGKYTFSELLPGKYNVAEVLQPDWIQTSPVSGSGEITQITSNDTIDDNSPRISGNNVVWSGYDYTYYDPEIYFYDGTTVSQLTDNDFYEYGQQISGNKAVWYADNYEGSQIFYYNGSNVSQLTQGYNYNSSPQIDGNNVVWNGVDYNSGDYDYEIYLYNGSSIRPITDNDFSDFNPQISGNNVVWYGYDYNNGYDGEIYLYNGSSIRQLTDNDFDDYSPQISGNNVVWSGYDYNNGYDGEIYYYDGSSITQLTDNEYEDYSPQISGTNVVWEAYDGNDYEIFYYDGNNVTQVTDNSYDDYSPQISGDIAVWGSSNGEIYYYDGSAVTQLTDSENYDSSPDISDNNVTWSGYDGVSDNEIFITSVGGNIVNLEAGETVTDVNFGNYYSIIDGTSGNDQLVGTALRDVINGKKGNDNISGKEDNDVLNGDEGNDNLHGDEGNDELNGGDGNDVLTGDEGNDVLNGGNGKDNLSGNEGDDSLNGGSLSDILNGNEGNDSLNGEDDQDVLNGNQGQDTLLGGKGNDSLYGNEDNDLLNGGDGNDLVYGNQATDTLSGDAGNDKLYGNQGNDELNGGSGSDTLYGDENNDTLNGGNDNDVLYGGEGDDRLTGGSQRDIFVLTVGHGSDTVTDFQDRQDRFGLSSGLTFGQLTISSDSGNTLISLTSSNELLATLTGINSSLITANDFVTV